MEGSGILPPPPPPQCYNEIKKASAYRVNGLLFKSFLLPPRLTCFLLATLEPVCNGLTLIPDLADFDLQLLHASVLDPLLMETEVEEVVDILVVLLNVSYFS